MNKIFRRLLRFGLLTITLVGLLPVLPAAFVSAAPSKILTTVDLQIQASNDDAIQANVGPAVTNTAEITLGDNGTYPIYAGLRFTNVPVEPGATVSQAFLTITSQGGWTNGLTVTIKGHNVNNSTAFTSANGPMNRSSASTTAQTAWTPGPWSNGVTYQSPDLTSIVQEIVNRPGWAVGNALSLIISDDGVLNNIFREIVAYDGDPSLAAELTIEYEIGQLVVNTTDGNDDGSCNGVHCSLFEAINAANGNPGPDTIVFNIPGSAPYVISDFAMPHLTDPGTTIDATTQAGYSNSPVVELRRPTSGGGPAFRVLTADITIRGLAITSFDGGGILIDGSGVSNTVIDGNYIGVTTDGVTALGNSSIGGIGIFGGASSIQIVNNVISGNITNGIWMKDTCPIFCTAAAAAAPGSIVIENNMIGTDADGTAALGNDEFGISVELATDVTITNNLVSGNVLTGIWLDGATNVTVEGNKVGTDVIGASALGNNTGVSVTGSSANVVIGGASASKGNLVSGNNASGIVVAASGVVVQNNYVGTGASGMSSLGNAQYGISVGGGSNSQILNNVISDNYIGVNVVGVSIFNLLIQDNLIGTNAAGTAALGSQIKGIYILGSVGTQVLDSVISGNTQVGVDILQTTDTTVQNNLIGLDISGTAAIGNGDGIHASNPDTSNLLIGGPGQGNVISGNYLGVQLVDISNVIVQDNYIGTDSSGTTAVGNTVGVNLIGTTGVVIGGGNIISGNLNDGIQMFQNANVNQVISNVIGLDVNGSPLGNGQYGVVVGGGSNQIGGPGQGNVISANQSGGISITHGSDHQIIDNIIGEDGNGNPAGNGDAAANIGAGITIQSADTVTVSQNIIAHNGWMGVHVWESNNNLISENEIYQNNTTGVNIFSGTGNTISQNSMYANGNLGINLYSPGEHPFGVTLNDGVGDTDSGSNTLLNYPEFTFITPSQAVGTACIGCIVEVFLHDGDPSGHGEGEVFLGSDVAIAGTGTFSVDISEAGLPPCTELTATTTDASGNTSEFSPNTASPSLGCLIAKKIPPPIIILVPGIVVGGWTYYRRRKPRSAAGGFLVGAVVGVAILLVGNALTRTTPAETGTEGQEPPPMIEQAEPDKDTPVPTPTPTPSPKLYCEGVLGVSLLDDGSMRTSVRVMGVTGSFDATLNTQDIICQSYVEYPDTLFCDSSRPEPGSWVTLTIFDPEGNAFCEETFSAPSRTIEDGQACEPPPGGCGDPKQGYYWDEKACKCNQCPSPGVYDEKEGKCVKP